MVLFFGYIGVYMYTKYMNETSVTSSLSESEISTAINFNTTFLAYLSELKEHKITYLSFLLTIQRLLLQEAAKNDWTKEYSETINNNLCVFEQLIFFFRKSP